MINRFKEFLRDESGNATIESLVVIGGSVWMAGVVVTDVTFASMTVTEKLNNRLEYTSIVSDILGDFGPEIDNVASVDPDFCAGNPGNDKCVGNAGENPNGDDDWGTGSNGRGDVSSSNENIGGNSSNAPGQNK